MGFPFCLGGRVADKISIAQKRWVEHGEDKIIAATKVGMMTLREEPWSSWELKMT